MSVKNDIPFNKIFLADTDTEIVNNLLINRLLGESVYIDKCERFFKENYGFANVFLTPSCTNALEMAALLLDIKEGDEVIMASYGYVSTANAFFTRGAKIIFIDSSPLSPNLNVVQIEELITHKTKAIVVTHYAGISCELEELIQLKMKYNLLLIEDAAHSLDAFYKEKSLGSFGDIATFSFHHTKNISCGQGGMIVLNNDELVARAKIIRERGTNRAEFLLGTVQKYTWHDIGSAFRPSELSSALLYSQLLNIELIQAKRRELWSFYWDRLLELHNSGKIFMPDIETNKKHSAHIFFFCLNTELERNEFIDFMINRGVHCCSHYIALHSTPFFINKHDGRLLKYAELYSKCLVRLPLFPDLAISDCGYICDSIKLFFKTALLHGS